MSPTTDLKLTAKELAEILNVSLSTVYRLKADGRLPYYQPGGKRHFVRFPKSALETTTDTPPREALADKPIPGPTPKWFLAESDQ